MTELDQLLNGLFLANPLQGLFIGLALLYFVMTVYIFTTIAPTAYNAAEPPARRAVKPHCHIRCQLLKWQAARATKRAI